MCTTCSECVRRYVRWNLFPKIDKNRPKKIVGLCPTIPHYGAAPISPTQVGGKCLATMVLDNQDRALCLHVDPTNLKLSAGNSFNQDGKTQPSTFRDLSFLQNFQQKRPMKNDAPAVQVLETHLMDGR